LDAVLQDNAVFAMKPGLQLLDPINPHDGRAVNAQEFPRIELSLQAADGLAQ
jgi:hypothetical protein